MRLELKAAVTALAAVGAKTVFIPSESEQILTSLSWDSRSVKPHGVYLAHRGEHVDGNDYIAQAIEADAAMIIATREPSAEIIEQARTKAACLVVASDELQALWAIAKCYRAKLNCLVVGVTGSVGKTSTKDFVASVLATKYKTVATAGNYNNEYGLPATVLDAELDTEALVLEMGMEALGEIAALADIAQPQIGVITNIGVSHLEKLGSQENIARAKAELISALPDNSGVAILPGDDPWVPFVLEQAECAQHNLYLARYGQDRQNDMQICNLELDSQARPTFDLWLGDGIPHRVCLNLTGAHNALNAAAAAAVGVACKIEPLAIVAALQAVEPTAMRQEVLQSSTGAIIINDAYNASPDSMRSALRSLQQMAQASNGKTIAVLGDMAQLGTDEIEYHQRIGSYADSTNLQLLITVGLRAQQIAKGAIAAGMLSSDVIVTQDVRSAVAALQPYLQNNTFVLVKASRSIALERVVAEIL